MSARTAAAAVAGALLMAGVLLAAITVSSRGPARSRAVRQHRRTRLTGRRELLRGAAVALIGAVAWVATGWPVAGLLAGAGVWWLPAVLGPDREAQRTLERTEAIATWAESLRDTLGAAHGLRQALLATAPLAPPAIRGHVVALSARIEHGMLLPNALRAFAVDLADPVGDLVAAALVQAADNQARHLAPLLGSLATTAREQAAARTRIATSRARAHTTVRIITATTALTVIGLVMLNRPFLAPYATGTGQLVLLVVGALFAAGLWWMRRLAIIDEPDRILAPTAEPGDDRSASPDEGTEPWKA